MGVFSSAIDGMGVLLKIVGGTAFAAGESIHKNRCTSVAKTTPNTAAATAAVPTNRARPTRDLARSRFFGAASAQRSCWPFLVLSTPLVTGRLLASAASQYLSIISFSVL